MRSNRLIPIILLLSLAFLGASSAAATLKLAAPLDYQVIQRNAQNQASVTIKGDLDAADPKTISLEARIVANGTNGGWQKLAASFQQQTFQAKLELPAGGWYRIEVRALSGGQPVAGATVEHVGVGEVFVIAGQSNSANHGEEKQTTKTSKVATFDGKRWLLSSDPQPGASGGGGSFLPPFGDAMAQRFNVPVGFIACGIGATSVREWLPKGAKFPNPPTLTGRVQQLPSGEWESKGEAYEMLVARMKQLGPHGFRAVLWHQGESDANQTDATRTLPGKLYREYLERVIRESRREIGWDATWFVAQVSYHVPGDEASPDIRAAQASLWKDGIALEGPDTDALKSEWRDSGGKGVHFSGPGLREHAARWEKKVSPWLGRHQLTSNPAKPDQPNEEWRMRHAERVAEVKNQAEKLDVLFLGDSITGGWRDIGKAIWEKEFVPLHAINIGIAGSQTQHLLWQIENGAIDGIHPRVAVLMIGVNHLLASPAHSPADVARGIGTIVSKLREKLPRTQILLLATFPKDKSPGSPDRRKIQEINSLLAKLDDHLHVRFFDLTQKFLSADGTLTSEISPDGVHLNSAGYAIWAEALKPLLQELLESQPASAPANKIVHVLVPGFTVRELPVKLSNLNNVEYAPDGRLFAAGYDGRFHLLRDTDGDGLEDQVKTFWSESSENYPLGMVLKDGAVYTVLTDEVVRYRDTNGDGIPDRRETVVKGFDDPELVKAPYLMHRRVDSSMALTFGTDGALYVTMGNSAPGNAYWNDSAGVKHYSTAQRRGCLLRFGPKGKVETLATGLRYIMSLQWNRHGDLFGTDQEGATWVPNGNPFDELLYLQPGRHYGFPPAHPRWLTNVVDEPSVWDYVPQHESTCGFRFNGPTSGHGRFGPEFWADNAIVTGEARGKLYRTVLAKTASGYVAHTDLFARLGMLTVDCTISPQGDLVVCCHSGDPDWGTGPTGEGRIFKISHTEALSKPGRSRGNEAQVAGKLETPHVVSYSFDSTSTERPAPQPVLTWPASETETVIGFDRPLAAAAWADIASRSRIIAGRYVEAADRLETIRPGYEIVKMQQRERQSTFVVNRARLGDDGRSVVLETAPRTQAIHYALAVASQSGALDVAHDLSGLAAEWRGTKGAQWNGWLPHPDFVAAREFTRASATHDALWQKLATRGTLTLRGQLDLWQMLIPATQPGANLDYTPEPETVTVVFKSDAALTLSCAGGKVDRISKHEARLTLAGPRENQWLPLTLTLATPSRKLEVGYSTTRDPRPRALATHRFLLPFATPAAPEDTTRVIPEIAGGNWNVGRELFRGKATCITCHKIRGEGVSVGPDLSNVIHRDYASTLRDIIEPSATINPDAIGYVVQLKDDEEISGTRVGETATELHIAQPGGRTVKLPKNSIIKTAPMKISLMPTGLDKALTPEELQDLLTFLLTEAPPPPAK